MELQPAESYSKSAGVCSGMQNDFLVICSHLMPGPIRISEVKSQLHLGSVAIMENIHPFLTLVLKSDFVFPFAQQLVFLEDLSLLWQGVTILLKILNKKKNKKRKKKSLRGLSSGLLRHPS